MQNRAKDLCPVAKKCGGCQYQGVPYEKQLQEKEKTEAKLSDKMERWVYLNDLAERIEEQKKEKRE